MGFSDVSGLIIELIYCAVFQRPTKSHFCVHFVGFFHVIQLFCIANCTSQQKVDITLYFYTSFNEHNTPYTVLESDNSESMPDVLH